VRLKPDMLNHGVQELRSRGRNFRGNAPITPSSSEQRPGQGRRQPQRFAARARARTRPSQPHVEDVKN
jgi:hypothetical protein